MDVAWNAYKAMHGHEITFSIKSLPTELDIDATFEELRKVVKRGRNPASLMTRLGLSKSAKLIFDIVKVDDHGLITEERITVTQSYLSYLRLLKKIRVTWNLSITTIIDEPDIDIESSMPLAHIDDFIIKCLIIVLIRRMLFFSNIEALNGQLNVCSIMRRLISDSVML
ncbi:MAG: hypothetical protein DCC43_01115 [Candidatus Brocadia sp.]|nr:hypothetical protein [Candidatus Brocadia sp.]MCE7910509.1 hypothetical protein [Candidatus Brocadia sp. AMX3]RIK03081.1 MAG: hypothetical protein DCC43_01115 [Candidatus Brocadia sp.]UJS19353.1 MAG: hypothetical protein L3J18_10545 [Candidatus Brocadia sp.]